MHKLFQKEKGKEVSFLSPLERGLASTGRVYVHFSLQLFTVLILFLIFDLEIVLVVGLAFAGKEGALFRRSFVFLVLLSL